MRAAVVEMWCSKGHQQRRAVFWDGWEELLMQRSLRRLTTLSLALFQRLNQYLNFKNPYLPHILCCDSCMEINAPFFILACLKSIRVNGFDRIYCLSCTGWHASHLLSFTFRCPELTETNRNSHTRPMLCKHRHWQLTLNFRGRIGTTPSDNLSWPIGVIQCSLLLHFSNCMNLGSSLVQGFSFTFFYN